MKVTRPWIEALLLVIGSLLLVGSFFVFEVRGATAPPEGAEAVSLFRRGELNLETAPKFLPVVLQAWSPETAAREGVVISEVLYDPLETEPGGEWIEIYNPGEFAVDLFGFKVGDEEMIGGSEGMLRFPEGAVLPAKEVVLIANQATVFHAQYGFYPDFEMRLSHPDVPTLALHAAWAGGNVVLLNTSDEVLLLNERDDLVDAISWGNSVFAFDPPAPDVPPGYSLERAPAGNDLDQSSDWRAQAVPQPGQVDLTFPTLTPTATNSQAATPTGLPTGTPTPPPTDGPSPTPSQTPTPFQGELKISEVQYDPANPEPVSEWIEIYYPGVDHLNLAGFMVGDEETQGGGEGMAAFPGGAEIGPDQTVLIAREGQAFHAQFGFYPDYEFSDSAAGVPDMVPAINWAVGSVSLGNAGDEVLVLDPTHHMVDAVSWGSSVFAFNPSALDIPEGHSLERVPADQDTNTAADWVDQPSPDPGAVRLGQPTNTPTPVQPTQSLTPSPTSTATSAGSVTLTPSPTPGTATHLLISEVFYDTPGTDSQEEWIEILNPIDAVVPLAGYKLGDEETAGGLEGMFIFPSGAEIAAGMRILVAQTAVGFFDLYGFLPDYEIYGTDPVVPDLLPYEPWATGSVVLSNAGDEILLIDPHDQPIDVVVYENGNYPGVIAHPGVASGHSIARFPATQDTEDCSADFVDLEIPSPGT